MAVDNTCDRCGQRGHGGGLCPADYSPKQLCIACGATPAMQSRFRCAECIKVNRKADFSKPATTDRQHNDATHDRLTEAAAVWLNPRETPAGHDLMDFMNSCKAQGLRTAKGEFVASDGTRMPYDWSFERSEKKGRDDG